MGLVAVAAVIVVQVLVEITTHFYCWAEFLLWES